MQVVQNYRYTVPNLTLREVLRGGALGRLNYLVGRFAADYRLYGSWGKAFRHEIPHGLLVEGSIHHFDMLRNLAGCGLRHPDRDGVEPGLEHVQGRLQRPLSDGDDQRRARLLRGVGDGGRRAELLARRALPGGVRGGRRGGRARPHGAHPPPRPRRGPGDRGGAPAEGGLRGAPADRRPVPHLDRRGPHPADGARGQHPEHGHAVRRHRGGGAAPGAGRAGLPAGRRRRPAGRGHRAVPVFRSGEAAPSWCGLRYFEVLRLPRGASHTFERRAPHERLVVGSGACRLDVPGQGPLAAASGGAAPSSSPWMAPGAPSRPSRRQSR